MRPVIRQKLVKLCETLKRDKLQPWLWFNSRGVNITDFYGKTICMTGVLYAQTPANVFWNFIDPFLRDAIVTTLDETLQICHAREHDPEPYIRETAMLLDGSLIWPIYGRIAVIDWKLRGNGNPKSVKRRDVTDKATEMVEFLNTCKDEMIQGIQAEDHHSETPGGGKADTKEQPWDDKATIVAQNTGQEVNDTPVTLREFMEIFCAPKLMKNLRDSRVKALQSKARRRGIELPEVEGEYTQGQSKKYRPLALVKAWPKYRESLPNLPELKPEFGPKLKRS